MFDETLNMIQTTTERFHLGKSFDYNKVLLLSDIPGTGKTYSALRYCSEYSDSLYFSFRHKDSSFALKVFSKQYPEIFTNCDDWNCFFKCLKLYGKEKRPTVFFDNVGDRNDDDCFIGELQLFLNENSSFDVMVILIARPWESVSVLHTEGQISHLNYYDIFETLSTPYNDAFRLSYITAGIPGLLSAYKTEVSFTENIKAMLNTSSLYYTLAKSWITESFRTPNSYTSLLYAMANGNNRVSELAKFSGFPKNKCDKYIKALIEHGLVRKEISDNGYAKYYPANSYLSLWCGVLLTVVPNSDGTFGDDTYMEFMKHLNQDFLTDFYRDICFHWLKENISSFSTSYVDANDEACRNINVNGMNFDFISTKDTQIYAYFNIVSGDNLSMKLWKQIEDATIRNSPFYNNEYIICTVNRVPDSYWKLSKQYDNVHIVKLESLFAAYMEDYNKLVHPRFVPSFVNYRR